MELRHDLRLIVGCSVSFAGKEFAGQGTVLNVSTGGWLVDSGQTVPSGTPLLLQVSLPDGEEPLEIQLATVRWCTGRMLGLKNMILGENEWRRLRRFVVSNTRKSDFSSFK